MAAASRPCAIAHRNGTADIVSCHAWLARQHMTPSATMQSMPCRHKPIVAVHIPHSGGTLLCYHLNDPHSVGAA